MSTNETAEICEILKLSNLIISESQAEQLYDFYKLLIEKNRVMNLTAITEFDEVVKKHFADSLSIVRDIHMEDEKSLIDIGTGAGFPGIPLKIVYPHINCVLVDSLGKRVEFLENVIRELGLERISAIHSRSEDLARDKKYREKFDLCTSRAVANLQVLSEYCLPFVELKGHFVAYKSGNIEDEVNNAKKAIHILGGEVEKLDTFEMYEMGRCFVVIKKTAHTPHTFPRKAGTPSKSPLI